MAYLELVRCRLAIQCCIGYFPDGRERHRTFSLRDVRPDAPADALASVVRAIAPLLRYPITKVSIVKKYVLISDVADVRPTPQAFLYFARSDPQFARHGCRRLAGAVPEAKIIGPALLKMPKMSKKPKPASHPQERVIARCFSSLSGIGIFNSKIFFCKVPNISDKFFGFAKRLLMVNNRNTFV